MPRASTAFCCLGMSQGCAICVAFAVRHPERVSHLVLDGGFARGAYRRAKNELELQQAKALATARSESGWGSESPVFRQSFCVAVHDLQARRSS